MVSQLNAGLDIPDLQISEAKDYEEALEHLKSGFFDLVVLDLVLPAADQDPSALVARSLIRQVTTGGS
ncbi:hypothetical protein [Caulobacter sp. UC70_42]|uniref:hypothetical protein n=1 Tax=Caulobacter sp. UC70_42 TaxID=3374551 RepID=UPI003757770E